MKKIKYNIHPEVLIKELRWVADQLGRDQVSQNEFEELSRPGRGCITTARYHFGSWNKAVVAAGLRPYLSGVGKKAKLYEEDDLLQEIIRLHKILGKQPPESLMSSEGRFSPRPYRDRWGSWTKARIAAYKKFGKPYPNCVNNAY